MRSAKWEMNLAGTREAGVRWRHGHGRARTTHRGSDLFTDLAHVARKLEGARYVLECALQTAGYGVVTLGAAWLLWRFVP
jgi:hypothetical protein